MQPDVLSEDTLSSAQQAARLDALGTFVRELAIHSDSDGTPVSRSATRWTTLATAVPSRPAIVASTMDAPRVHLHTMNAIVALCINAPRLAPELNHQLALIHATSEERSLGTLSTALSRMSTESETAKRYRFVADEWKISHED
ncbi:hypothetical protein EIP86_007985 [Pleurotus ostreatoroseus]|nr:hypothetical protein EIP86_007985 [Pleurotus ostreatoroseus]